MMAKRKRTKWQNSAQ